MPDTLKKLTDKQRDLLRLLGTTPETFQASVEEILQRKVLGKGKNTEYRVRSGRIKTIKQIVEGMTPRREPLWIPLAYVYFVRRAQCLNCGASTTCLESPSLYILEQDKHKASTQRYLPVSAHTTPSLPRLTKEFSTKTLFCLQCYTLAPRPAPQKLLTYTANGAAPCR